MDETTKNRTVTIVCRCRVVTPMFSSGADQTKCEIRVPEIKAAMRFWWRAAHSNLGPEELRKKETLIFGGSGDKEARKSSFTMRVEVKTENQIDYYGQNDWEKDAVKVETGKNFPTNIFDYLAYGVSISDYLYVKKGDKYYNRITRELEWLDPNNDRKKINKKHNFLQRKGIAPGSTFDLVIRFDQQYEAEIKEILKLFSCFGSLGAKSRNGFGKIVIDKIDGMEWKPFKIKDLYKKCLEAPEISKDFPEYTAFTGRSYLFSTEEYPTWQKALHKIGDAYRMARIGENFKEGLRLNSSDEKGDHRLGSNRQYIALPLKISYNEDFIDTRNGKPKKNKVEFKVEKLGLERMAKQFFMIVEQEGKKQYRGYILHLPFNIETVAPKVGKEKWLADNKEKWRAANEEMKRRIKEELEKKAKEPPKQPKNNNFQKNNPWRGGK